MLEELSAASAPAAYKLAKSAVRADIALLVCALFLQRFTVPFGDKSLSLTLVPVVLILFHQFASGRLLIRYDRLLWYIALTLAATASLLLRFNGRMLTAYGEFMVLYFLFTFSRTATAEQYRGTLRGFQFLVLILCVLAIVQFPAQFVIDGRKLIMFFGVFPDFLLSAVDKSGWNTEGIITVAGHELLKSNGIFLVEPSTMSQIAAFAIVIEVLQFRRRRYLIVLTLGLLLAYSGTGISALLLSLPLAALVKRNARLPTLLVGILAIGLLATGIIHLSAFTQRVGEFGDTHASAFLRFVSPFWEAGDHFATGSLFDLLTGNGPGSTDHYVPHDPFYSGGGTWFKLFYEYGLISVFIFTCFLGACFHKSRCPMPLIVGIMYIYLFTGNNLVDPAYITITVVLCTLSGPEPRRGLVDRPTQNRTPLVAGSSAG